MYTLDIDITFFLSILTSSTNGMNLFNRPIANGRSAWETCFWFCFGGISFLLYTSPYAYRGESVYHLHKQTQIFSVSLSKSVLMSGFDIFISSNPCSILPCSLPPSGWDHGWPTWSHCQQLALRRFFERPDQQPQQLHREAPCQLHHGALPAASWGPASGKQYCSDIFLFADCWTFTLTKGAFVRSRHGLEVDCWPTEGTLTLGNQGVVTQSVLERTKMTFTWWLSRAGWIFGMEIRDGHGYLEITIVIENYTHF